jgi:hypothetical protein
MWDKFLRSNGALLEAQEGTSMEKHYVIKVNTRVSCPFNERWNAVAGPFNSKEEARTKGIELLNKETDDYILYEIRREVPGQTGKTKFLWVCDI